MNIHLVTNLTTFPAGTAAAKRIKMIAKALIHAGYTFSLYTNTLSYNQFNGAPTGVFESIPFKYLHGTTDLKKSKIKKLLLFIKGIIALKAILRRMKPSEDIVYIYAHGNIFNVITVLLCKMYRIKVVQEINEWDYDEIKAPFKKWILHNTVVRKSNGAVVISQNIKNTVLAIKPEFTTVTIPVLEDPADYNTVPLVTGSSKYCFWMGQVNGYINDVLLILEACAKTYHQGYKLDLIISGPCNDDSRIRLMNKVRELEYPLEKLRLLGYISEEELAGYCRNAFCFIIPLWNSQKSFYRFPTKLASFMFCGRPVLTAQIGEVGEILTDGKDTLFFEPGNADDLAAKIEILFNNPALYEQICMNTRSFAEKQFNYSVYELPLKQFFTTVINHS